MNKFFLLCCLGLSFICPLFAMEKGRSKPSFLNRLARPFVAMKNVWGECPKTPDITGLTVRDALARCKEVQKKQTEYWVGRAWISLFAGFLGLYCAQKARGLDIWTPCTGVRGKLRGYFGLAIGFCAGCYLTQQLINMLTKFYRAKRTDNLIEIFDDVECMSAGNEKSVLRVVKQPMIGDYLHLRPESVLTQKLAQQECEVARLNRVEFTGAFLESKRTVLAPLVDQLNEEAQKS